MRNTILFMFFVLLLSTITENYGYLQINNPVNIETTNTANVLCNAADDFAETDDFDFNRSSINSNKINISVKKVPATTSPITKHTTYIWQPPKLV